MSQNYCIVATFDSASTLYHAAEKVRDAGFHHWDVFTPFPVHGLDKAMGLKRSRVPVFTFAGGLTGCLTGILITWFMGKYDYPLIVGGKPFFDFIFPLPIIYELTILFAAFATLGSMLYLNRLTRPYHSVMNHPKWQKVTDDTFFILIESKDPKFNEPETKTFLETIGGNDVRSIEP